MVRWAVTIDHCYQIFETEAAAKAVYDAVGGNPNCPGDELADTPFGSAFMVPFGDVSNLSWVTTECDLVEYMANAHAELARRVEESRKRWQEANPNGLEDIFGEFFLDV